jgi:hypothetical protein
MGYALNELFNQMNGLGLTFSRTSAGELQVVGDTSNLTDAIRQAIGEHRQTILFCLPQASPAASPEPATCDSLELEVQALRGPMPSTITALQASPEPPAIQAANAIRQQLIEFGLWLQRFAWWAEERYLSSIDRRLAEAVDTQKPQTVAHQIEALRQEIEGIVWAESILPHAFEAEAKHATEAGAGPARSSADGDEVPF